MPNLNENRSLAITEKGTLTETFKIFDPLNVFLRIKHLPSLVEHFEIVIELADFRERMIK